MQPAIRDIGYQTLRLRIAGLREQSSDGEGSRTCVVCGTLIEETVSFAVSAAIFCSECEEIHGIKHVSVM